MSKLERPNLSDKGAGLLWHPIANIHKLRMKTHGKYLRNYPKGAIVHYTAGERPGTLDWGIAQGYCYLLIDGNGQLHQAHPINEWGYHAGASSYKGLQGSVSDELIGIEIACAGRVEQVIVNGAKRYKAWFHKNPLQYFTEDQVRYSGENANIKAGYYHKYTPAQEETLIHTLQWLKWNDPYNVFAYDYVLGHDEVSPNRKQDPGASLSMSMPELRKLLSGKV